MGVVKIGYLSFDASVKIHQSGTFSSTKNGKTGFGGTAGYIRHIDRSTDKRNGCEVQHSNPDIDSDLTLENESYFRDENGEWQKTSHSKDMVNAINRRIEYAKSHGARISTKGKNDTVIVRPLVVQLDSDSITGHEDTWTWDIISILEEQFGKNNITGFSIHKDETNVHMHISFVPCYETEKDGKIKAALSQTKFFNSPKQLAGLHRKIRKLLLDKGYDIEQENKPIEEHLAGYTDKNGVYHQMGVNPEILKALSDRQIQLQLGEIDMALRKSELDRLKQTMSEMGERAKAEQEKNRKERENLLLQQTALDNDRADVKAQSQTLMVREMNVQKRETEVDEMLKKIHSTAEICNQILSEEKHLNTKFLEFLDREGKRNGKEYRRHFEYWYKKFLEERKKKYSDWYNDMAEYSWRNDTYDFSDNTHCSLSLR